MTLQQLKALLDQAGYPVAYNHFNSAPSIPFIVYRLPSTSNFDADNVVYHNINNVEIELYTNKKDLTAEKKLEDVLKANELPYQTFEVWIDSEKLFQRIYETRLI
ncbi:hypothetical protein EauS123_00044 [Exiguobacterium phage vB_EauS-123]|nr:hypothetical protein EauS123_00044 [Exiguobacterium phage vB_EauS-123]